MSTSVCVICTVTPMTASARANGYVACQPCRATQPKPAAALSTQRCRTCENFVLLSEARQGTKRCKPCRELAPGRRQMVSPKVRQVPQPAQHTAITPSRRRAPERPSQGSWWVDHPRDGFTARGEQAFPRIAESSVIPNLHDEMIRRAV